MSRAVLIVAYDFPPISAAGVFRTLRYTKYLREFGWEPLILSVQPDATNRSQDISLLDSLPPDLNIIRTGVSAPDEWLKQRLGLGKKKVAASHNSSASPSGSLDQFPQSKPSSPWWPGSWARYMWDFVFQTPDDKIWWIGPAVKAARVAIEEHNPDVVYSTGPPHSTHVIATKISRNAGIPLVADFRDPWARAPWRATERNPWGARLHERYERRLLRHASQVILNTPRLATEFRDVYPRHEGKLCVITNGYDPDHLPLVDQLIADHNSQSPFLLCHPGTLYNRRDPRPLVEAIRRIVATDNRVVFQQIGPHDSRFELAKISDNPELREHVAVIPRLPHQEVFGRMANSNCLVLIQPGTQLQVPSKIFEMIMFRKPILALADQGATADIVQDYELGVVAAPNKVDEIETAVRTLMAAADRGESRGKWDQALADFDGRKLTESLSKALERAVAAR